jgi:hypothetical protein
MVARIVEVRVLSIPTAVVVALAGVAIGLGTTSGSALPSAGALGAYAGNQNPSAVAGFASAIGAQPAFAMDFLDGSSWASIVASASSFPAAWGTQYQMTWGVDMLPNSGASLSQEAAGDYDPTFVQVAQNLVVAGQGSATIRLGWEFNGDWFPWGTNAGSPTDFAGAFRHVVTAMRQAAGQHFTFEWNPTVDMSKASDAWYPGDAYVDDVGLDLYDQTVAAYPGPAAAWATYLSAPTGLNWLASFAAAHGKKITFPEWGLGYGANSGGDDPTFIDNMAKWINTHNVTNALFWDDGDWVGTGHNPNTVAALNTDFAGAAPQPPPPTGGGAITISAGTCPVGTVGVSYSCTLRATSAAGPVSWTTPSPVPAGPAPGLSWSGNLNVTGTPTAVGTTSVTFTVTDTAGHQASVPVAFVIAPAPVSTSTTTTSLPPSGPTSTTSTTSTSPTTTTAPRPPVSLSCTGPDLEHLTCTLKGTSGP